MSKHQGSSHNDQGAMKSYALGFVLSLIFTLIPYYLVVNKVLVGTELLITIVAFAFVQLIIQVVFFLHLGRGPKPNWNLIFFVLTVILALIVVGGSVLIMNNLHYNMSPEEKIKDLINKEGIYQVEGKSTGACEQLYENHKIVIKNGLAYPSYVVAQKCDTLTFVNEDGSGVEITFGSHPEHGVYAGVDELAVRNGRGKSITLSEVGTFQFHNHLNPETAGAFTVNE